MPTDRPTRPAVQKPTADRARGEPAVSRMPPSTRAAVLLLSAGAAIALITRVGWRPDLAAYVLVLAGLGPALSAVDIRILRLPDRAVLPGAVSAATMLSAAAFAQGQAPWLIRSAAGGAAAFAFLYALAWVGPGRLGFGDVKAGGLLLGPLLAWTGWGALFVAGLLAFASSGLTGMLMKGHGVDGEIPFGPFLFAAAAVAVLLYGPPP